jgi:hypothetical protein
MVISSSAAGRRRDVQNNQPLLLKMARTTEIHRLF